jgi:hypothetical protein
MEHIKKLLQNKFFSELNKRKKDVDDLQKLISSYLPDAISKKIIVKNLLQNQLILEVNNNTTAHVLKMHEADLLRQLVNESYVIKKIKVKIAIPKYQRKKAVVRIPSSVNKKLISLSRKMSDSPLKKIAKDLFKTEHD